MINFKGSYRKAHVVKSLLIWHIYVHVYVDMHTYTPTKENILGKDIYQNSTYSKMAGVCVILFFFMCIFM